MSTRRQALSSVALVVVTAALCVAQNIAPAHSGIVQYFQGDVTVDGVKVARFSEMQEQSVLQTGPGRAEILLTPGVILRVGENTSVRMLDNRLLSTRVEFLSGIAMVEAVDAGKSATDPPVTIVYKDFEVQPLHSDVFEITSQPSQVRVFKGEAKVNGNNTSLNVRDGNLVGLAMTMASTKFDAKHGDDLYVWSRKRSSVLSIGNISSASMIGTCCWANAPPLCNKGSLSGHGPTGSMYATQGWNPAMWNGFSGGWYYNQCIDMYSYIPFAGKVYSPFGWALNSPHTFSLYDQVNIPFSAEQGRQTPSQSLSQQER